MGAEGALKRGAEDAINAEPKAPFPRRVREISPKAGISRVLLYNYTYYIIIYLILTNSCIHLFSLMTYIYVVF